MKEMCLNETDQMGKIMETMKVHETTDSEGLLEQMEELDELIDLHPVNALNLHRMGGFKLLMQIMLLNPTNSVRRQALKIFAGAVQNNKELQEVAFEMGGLELLFSYAHEKDPKNKDSIIGALSSLLRTTLNSIKSDFMNRMEGVQWLRQVLLDPTTTAKTIRKVAFLLFDLMVKESDPNTSPTDYNANFVKDKLLEAPDLIERLMLLVNYSESDRLQPEHSLRDYCLKVFGGLIEYQADLFTSDRRHHIESLQYAIDQYLDNIDPESSEAYVLTEERRAIASILDGSSDFLHRKTYTKSEKPPAGSVGSY